MKSDSFSLLELGFSAYFLSQMSLEELEDLVPMRVIEVQRDRLTAIGENNCSQLLLPAASSAGEYAVGDWVLVDENKRLSRCLQSKSSLKRRAAGTDATVQLIANNVDTLFVVSSCNKDFSVARLERYLALAKEAEVDPVILLTKADLSDDVELLQQQAESLMSYLEVVPLNATDLSTADVLKPWCGTGQTVALVGSSGVGKTTLLNALTGEVAETQAIRDDDSKGRHTTTARSMRAMLQGGWVIDTPGMRALRLHDSSQGIDAVFDEITQRAKNCRFADCDHQSEPGCAVQDAIVKGELDAERLARWRKLQREDLHNTQTLAESRQREKQFVKKVNQAMSAKQQRKRH